MNIQFLNGINFVLILMTVGYGIHHGFISKNFWNKHFNLSFSVIDKSNKKSIVAVVPLFLIKRKKINRLFYT